MVTTIFLLCFSIFLCLSIILIYNSIIKQKLYCENAWSDIDVHLKKRHEMIPNLVNCIKGYLKHEELTLRALVEARNMALTNSSLQNKMIAENQISEAIPRLFGIAEAYPDLKANTLFLDLQKNLTDVENDLGQARRFYNACVRDYNSDIQIFPKNIISSLFKFTEKDFFLIDIESKAMPKVDL